MFKPCFRNCCFCCCSIEAGSIIIAIVNLIFTIPIFIMICLYFDKNENVRFSNYFDISDEEPLLLTNNNLEENYVQPIVTFLERKETNIYIGIWLALVVVRLLCQFFILIGVIKKNAILFIPHLVIEAIGWIFYTLTCTVALFMHTDGFFHFVLLLLLVIIPLAKS